MGNPSHAIRNLALTAALLLATVPVGLGGKVQSAEGRQSIIVERSGLPPSVVAAEPHARSMSDGNGIGTSCSHCAKTPVMALALANMAIREKDIGEIVLL